MCMNSKYVSIIIPTYNDWQRLFVCIEALLNQTYPKEMFEVIIINNNPHNKIPANFSLPMNYKLLNETKPGSYAARNTGLQVAKGEILGFTDSDCVPDKDWIKNAITYFLNNDYCSRIAGHISLFPKSAKATVAEKYDKVYSFKQKAYVTKFGTCVTANLFAYKHVFDSVGFFNESKMSSGDLDWGIEAHKAGYKIDYVENVIINHPARNLQELIKKEKRLAGGREKVYRKEDKLLVYFNFFKEARPLLGEYNSIRNKDKYLSSGDAFLVFLLRIRMRYIRAYEVMKLRLGKKPNRE